jgi:predicted ATPase/class 3 adenylate cyclase
MNSPGSSPHPDSPPNENTIWGRGKTLPTGTITFLFTDIQGSTPLWERQPEQMAEALQIHNAALRGAIEAHGGAVFKTVGDAFQAAFDTAPQGLRAAIEGQRALQAAAWNELGPLAVRMGLHTGEAELDPGGDEYAVCHAKNRIGRIHSAAHGGQILLSQETTALVARNLPEGVRLKDLGEHRLKGMQWLEHLYQVNAPGLTQEFPPLATTITHPNNLPLQLTSFIGRDKEIAAVEDLLSRNRLVTLTGSGGVGKTRLSIQVAGEMLAEFPAEFPHGVWYVELAPLADPALVPQTIALTFGLREVAGQSFEDVLATFLKPRKALIVLDNCEHLIEACACLTISLLRSCPDLKLLATSREAMGVAGEAAYGVPSLSLPVLDEISVETIQSSEAVRLFVTRAQGVMTHFLVTPENAQPVARICRRLDGIPLALELAAARLNMLTTEQLASRLDHAFRLLTGGSRTTLPRQQTLRATIDWSYQLLNDQERSQLRRLAVFAGGFSLEGAEQVCSRDGLDDWQIFDLLASLVDKSIVNADRALGAETRYRLLETVRQYAREKLFDAGESQALRTRHLEYYAALAQEAYPHLHGAGRLKWTRRVKGEFDNIREALEWAFQDASLAQLGLGIATNLADRFLFEMGYHQEGEDWLKTGLGAAGDTIPKLLEAQVYYYLLRLELDESDQRKEILEQCIFLCREVGPEADRELSLALSADFYYCKGALSRIEEAIQIARGIGPAGRWALGEVLFRKSWNLISHPQRKFVDQAYAAALESAQIAQTGDRWGIGPYWTLGIVETWRGQIDQARQNLQKALDLSIEVESTFSTMLAYIFLGWHYRQAGQTGQALRCCLDLYKVVALEPFNAKNLFYPLGMVLMMYPSSANSEEDGQARQAGLRLIALADKIGVLPAAWIWFDQADKEQALEQLRWQMGEAAYQAVWNEGQAMTLDEGVALAASLLEKYALEEYE